MNGTFSNFSVGDLCHKGYDSICVGKALKLKELLVEEFSTSHSDLGDKLYVASTATDKILDKKDPLSVETIDKEVYKNLNVHCTLALRIRVQNRKGFLFFELVLYNDKPAIIMEDNASPTTSEIELPYGRVLKLKCVDNSYVISVIKEKNFTPKDNPNVFIFIAFVKRAFLRIDFAVKYYTLFFIKFPVIFISKRLNDKVNVGIILKPFERSIKILTANDCGRRIVEAFAFDYFSNGEVISSVEQSIERAAICLQKEPLLLRKHLESICVALLDKSFSQKSVSLMNYIRGL